MPLPMNEYDTVGSGMEGSRLLDRRTWGMNRDARISDRKSVV